MNTSENFKDSENLIIKRSTARKFVTGFSIVMGVLGILILTGESRNKKELREIKRDLKDSYEELGQVRAEYDESQVHLFNAELEIELLHEANEANKTLLNTMASRPITITGA